MKINKVLVLFLTTIFVLSCSNDQQNEINKKQNISPELIGKLHNEALDNIFKNESEFNFNTNEIGLKKQIIKKNKTFLTSKINTFKEELNPNIYDIDKNNSITLLDTDNLLTTNLGFYSKNFVSSNQNSTIFDKIDLLYDSNNILLSDKNILYNLFNAYKDNYNGIISNNELYSIAIDIKQIYIQNNPDYTINNVFITLSILEICTNSLEWFETNVYNNQNYTNNRLVPVVPIVAADAVGAVVGIAEGIVASGIINGTNVPVDGESVVVGALISAATSSIGAGVKVLGWVSKLF